MSNKAIRNIIIGLELFTAVMAIYGGVSLLVNAEAFGMKVAWLHGSPFTNYQIPAIALLVGVTGSCLLAVAALVWARHEAKYLASIAAGVILMDFEIVETYSIGMRNFQQPLMFAFGLTVAGLTTLLWRRNRQTGVAELQRQKVA